MVGEKSLHYTIRGFTDPRWRQERRPDRHRTRSDLEAGPVSGASAP